MPPQEGYGPERQLPITDAITFLISRGVYPTNAAKACGISEVTLANWLSQGAEWDEFEPDDYPPERAVDIAAYVAFLSRSTRAEALGLALHEQNVYYAAMSGREAGGRLSLEFLARRMPKVYSKRDKLDVSVGGREPAPVDEKAAIEAREVFERVAVPAGIDVADVLPALPRGE